MGKKGHVSRAGDGEIYDEPKSERVLIVLTPTGLATLDAIARSLHLSRSEAIERLIRGTLQSEVFTSETPDDKVLFITIRIQ